MMLYVNCVRSSGAPKKKVLNRAYRWDAWRPPRPHAGSTLLSIPTRRVPVALIRASWACSLFTTKNLVIDKLNLEGANAVVNIATRASVRVNYRMPPSVSSLQQTFLQVFIQACLGAVSRIDELFLRSSPSPELSFRFSFPHLHSAPLYHDSHRPDHLRNVRTSSSSHSFTIISSTLSFTSPYHRPKDALYCRAVPDAIRQRIRRSRRPRHCPPRSGHHLLLRFPTNSHVDGLVTFSVSHLVCLSFRGGGSPRYALIVGVARCG